VKQGEDSGRAVGGGQVEIGHATAEWGMSVAEVVVDVEAGGHSGKPVARVFDGK
jgi:hypothetical protein